MPDTLQIVPAGQPNDLALRDLPALAARTTDLAQRALSDRTKKEYERDWRLFEQFCRERQFKALPAEPATVGLYIGWIEQQAEEQALAMRENEELLRAALTKQDAAEVVRLTAEAKRLAQLGKRIPSKAATLARKLSSIAHQHSLHGHESPAALRHAAVKGPLQGFRNLHGTAQTEKAACTIEPLRKMLAHLPESLAGKRDRALLLVGFAAALRRSELVALQVRDVAYVEAGMVLTIRRSKTDPEGKGEHIAIHRGRSLDTCPVRSLQAWLEASGITSGPLFRGITRWGTIRDKPLIGEVVALLVKKYADLAGLDASEFSGHSLRAGLATQAAISGASERKIQQQTRHKGVTMLRRYIRDGNLFRDNVSGVVGL